MLISNFCQLPPVGQTALYCELSDKALELARVGRLAYEAIDRTAVLDRVMRQGSDDAESTAFRSTLVELRNDTVGESTWRLLLSRCKQNLPVDEVASFNNVIQLYSTRAAVNKYNHDRIRDL